GISIVAKRAAAETRSADGRPRQCHRQKNSSEEHHRGPAGPYFRSGGEVIMHLPKLPALITGALVLALFAPHVLLAQYTIGTVAGGGPNNLAALSASVGSPVDVARDAAGSTYIADYYSNRIFKVDTSNNLTVVAGNG